MSSPLPHRALILSVCWNFGVTIAAKCINLVCVLEFWRHHCRGALILSVCWNFGVTNAAHSLNFVCGVQFLASSLPRTARILFVVFNFWRHHCRAQPEFYLWCSIFGVTTAAPLVWNRMFGQGNIVHDLLHSIQSSNLLGWGWGGGWGK